MSTAHVLAAWLKRPDLHPSVFLDTLSLSRRDKDTMWPIYTKLHGKCQIVGNVKVKVADGGRLWWPKAKAVDASESLWSGDTKTENVGEGTEVKDPLVTSDIENKESPTTDQYHELQRLDEDEKEGSPTNDMEEMERRLQWLLAYRETRTGGKSGLDGRSRKGFKGDEPNHQRAGPT